MISVFKRAASKRLKQKKTVQQSAQVLESGESETLLDEVRALIAQVENVAEGQEQEAAQRLKQVHEQHKAVLARRRITGPLG